MDLVLGGTIRLPGGQMAMKHGLLPSGAQTHSEITAMTTVAAFALADVQAHEKWSCITVPENLNILQLFLPQKVVKRKVRVLDHPVVPVFNRQGRALTLGVKTVGKAGDVHIEKISDFDITSFNHEEQETVEDIEHICHLRRAVA